MEVVVGAEVGADHIAGEVEGEGENIFVKYFPICPLAPPPPFGLVTSVDMSCRHQIKYFEVVVVHIVLIILYANVLF